MDYLNRFTGKAILDEANGKIVFVTELPGFKTKDVTVKFDRVAKATTVEGENSLGALKTSRKITIHQDQLLENSVPFDEAYLYEFVTPAYFEVEDGILTVTFTYLKSAILEVPSKEDAFNLSSNK